MAVNWQEIPANFEVPARIPGTPYMTPAGVGRYFLGGLKHDAARLWLQSQGVPEIVPGHYDANDVVAARIDEQADRRG